MRIYDNGVYRDMTAKEEKAYKELISVSENEEDKLAKLAQQVNENAEQITATQEALCELYETVV